MPNLAATYLKELKKISLARNVKGFEHSHGASKPDLERLKKAYPETPQSLLDFLADLDGTYYREYNGEKVTLYVFGGILPYYLNSVEQILSGGANASIAHIYGDEMLDEMVGKGIDPYLPLSRMLHFSDCMNNGGSSSLYIDFNPSPGGNKGQIVRFVHDPDEYNVIAPSFDAFLQNNLDSGFDFVEEEEETPEDPQRIALLEKLKADDPAALELLRKNLHRFHILGIATEASTANVLRVYMEEMLRLYHIRDKETPTGYTYGDQFAYLLRNFNQFEQIFRQDKALLQNVGDFACQVKDATLIQLLNLPQSEDELKTEFRDNCNFSYVQDKYRALSPKTFFEQTELAWEQPSFYEYFGMESSSFARYVPGRRERKFRLDPRWKKRLLNKPNLHPAAFQMLCDLSGKEADLEALKAAFSGYSSLKNISALAWLTHALCLVGENMVDKYLDYVFAETLALIRADSGLFTYCFNSDPLFFEYAVRELENSDCQCYSDFTLIVCLRPKRSQELLDAIKTMLTNQRGQKAQAKLQRLLKKMTENG